MPDTDLIERDLRQQYPYPSAAATERARAAVMAAAAERPGRPARSVPARPSWRPVLVGAVVVVALALAAVAIAAGFGAFSGISAAQRAQTPADRIDPALLAEISGANSVRGAGAQLLPDSARLVKQLSDGSRIYAVATQDGELCVLGTGLPDNNGKNDAAAMGCGSPLTQSEPSTGGSFRANESTPAISFGIAIDSVTAVSFTAGSQEVTVPVKDNVWVYEGESPNYGTLTAHFKDGTTETFG